MAAKKNTKSNKKRLDFHAHLVLNQWLLSLFYQRNLSDLKVKLGNAEGIAQDGQTHFFHALTNILYLDGNTPLAEPDLRRYDLNIVRHWQRITAPRNQAEGHELQMKYFQYLSLLFAEIYLDWFFNRKTELAAALNGQMAQYRAHDWSEDLQPYGADDLNKIAFWNATGSGKTLLMHVNILQYLHYFSDGRGKRPDKVIVLTPNEGLSRQHEAELRQSGLQAALFDKNQSNSLNDSLEFSEIKIIDINKLADKDGDKTVSAEAFEGNNLVLVDEGHRGSSGNEWLRRREVLTRGGFSFEYSATLGQAASGGKTVAKAEEEILKNKAKLFFGSTRAVSDGNALEKIALTEFDKQKARQNAVFETYAKTVLFDYSYKFFYADGYGKESLILNMDDAAYAQHDKLYFTACLLSFYQQLYLFESHTDKLKEWNIEKPLMVFVGHTVNKKSNSDEESDIAQVVRHLSFFLNAPEQVQKWLGDLLANKAQILNAKGDNIFLHRFTPLMDFAGREQDLYADMLRRLFHAAGRQRLHLVNLKKADGELALCVGERGKPFGVINVGSSTDFLKAVNDADDFDIREDSFSDGLFHGINDKNSLTNFLIGSRKFAEGWSSWRVSTMGLLNMGKSEGSQIIQLFGRGVRLKGRDFSLKRSLPGECPHKIHLARLETLNIFGVRAHYMEQFKKYLVEEGITPADELLTVDFDTRQNLPAVKLKTLQLKDGYKDNQKLGFKRTQKIRLYEVPESWVGKIKEIHAVIDRYPRVEALATSGTRVKSSEYEQREACRLNSDLFDWFDWDGIYLKLADYKFKRTWNNLCLDKGRLKNFAAQNDWYTLYIPKSELAINSFADIAKQESLMVDLLKEYTDQFYSRLKNAYESQFVEEAEIDDQNGATQVHYRFEIDASPDGVEYEQRLLKLKTALESGSLKDALDWNRNNSGAIKAICFEPHLYYPIMHLENHKDLPLTMKPLTMNEKSEVQFVQDLQQAHNSGRLKEWTGGKDLYLLRNPADKNKGLGFALAGNFYPDFLLWLIDKPSGKQWLTFIDPKGIRHMNLDHAKIGLAEEVKTLQEKLQSDLTLESFILSVTPRKDLLNANRWTTSDFQKKHILFMDEANYLETLFKMILSGK